MQTQHYLFQTDFYFRKGGVLPPSLIGRGRFTPNLSFSIRQSGVLPRTSGRLVQIWSKMPFRDVFSDHYNFFSKKKRTLMKLSIFVPYSFLHVFTKNPWACKGGGGCSGYGRTSPEKLRSKISATMKKKTDLTICIYRELYVNCGKDKIWTFLSL